MIEVRVSELRDFLRCRKRWYYHKERGLEPQGPPPESWGTGSLFHAGMQAIYSGLKQGETPVDAAHAVSLAMPAMLKKHTTEGGNGEQAAAMVKFYWQHFGSKETFDEILQVEVPLDYTYGPCKVTGTMDLVYRKEGQVVIRDFKTLERSADVNDLYMPLDFQFQCYSVMCWKKYGVPPRLEMTRVRRDMPHEFTPSGRPSKTVDNPPEKYVRTIPIFHSTLALERFEERLQGVLRSIDREKFSQEWPRTDDKITCPSCPYFRLCVKEQIDGAQEDHELALLYSLTKEGTSHEPSSDYVTPGY